jgi:hypothetical protein
MAHNNRRRMILDFGTKKMTRNTMRLYAISLEKGAAIAEV